jgi:pilus assembly protein Flp/PilA
MLPFDQTLTPAAIHLRRLVMIYLPENEEGQGLVEYALILVLVAIVVIAILVILGPQIGNIFSRVTNGLGGT